jgi:hypothetical protein
MARYEAWTRLSPEKAIDRAARHFATVSGGLAVSSRTANSLCLESPDGYVTITVCPDEKRGKKNVMEIETSQFDSQVREFMRSL